MIPIIFPYKITSQTGKHLARALNTKRVRSNGAYRYKNNHLVINLGASTVPTWNRQGIRVLNHWDKVRVSHNKLTALNKLRQGNVNTVEFTTNKQTALTWINEGSVVMCRTQLTNHSGYGLIVAQTANQLVDAPLYTKYVKGNEYRIHVAKHGTNYSIFDMQQKRKQTDFQGDINTFVRSHHRGWVFCRDNLNVPQAVRTEAINALRALELDFGAVDIKFNNHYNQAYVLECNSSPSAEGTTLDNYVHEILAFCNGN